MVFHGLPGKHYTDQNKKNVSELEKKVYNFDTRTGEKTMMKCCRQYHKSFYIHATATIS